MKVVTSAQMRAIEQMATEHGMSMRDVMARAGAAVAGCVADMDGPVLVLIGPGNNGGDGLAAAEALVEAGRNVTLYTYRRSDSENRALPTVTGESDPDRSELARLAREAGVIIDALLGIGAARPPEESLVTILRTVNDPGVTGRRVAVDIPTGVEADTGAVPSEAFRADVTVCMGCFKVGDVVYPGAEYAGEVRLVGLGLEAFETPFAAVYPTALDIAALLPRRSRDSNKGSYGRVATVAGSRDFRGAATLCSLGSYRAGAGLVEVCSVAEAVASVAAQAAEPIFRILPEDDGRVARSAGVPIESALEKADVAVVGPGLGLSEETVGLIDDILGLLSRGGKRAVVDADGLNALARLRNWWERELRLVLTPHPGEMARLIDGSVAGVQADRVSIARERAQAWGVVVLLKGAGSVIAAPDGRVTINPTGSSNLATGGTGDVLSGVIGGLMAQGAQPYDAAVAGAFLHGLAGDMLRETLGEAGTIASDLLRVLPQARARVEGQARNRA